MELTEQGEAREIVKYIAEQREQLPKSLKNANIGTTPGSFDFSHNADLNKESYEIFKKYSRTSNHSLFFLGDVGTGKSHLAVATQVKRMWDQYFYEKYTEGFVFTQQMDLNHSIRRLFGVGRDETELYYKAKKAKYLVLDDLGEGNMTGAPTEYTMALIKYRVENNMQITLTTNLSIYELFLNKGCIFGPRLLDRLKAHCNFVELKGKSYRKLERDNGIPF